MVNAVLSKLVMDVPENLKGTVVDVIAELYFKDNDSDRMVYFVTYDGNIFDRCRFSVGDLLLTEGDDNLNLGSISPEIVEATQNLLNSVMRRMGDVITHIAVNGLVVGEGVANIKVDLFGDISEVTTIFESVVTELHSNIDGYLVSTVDKTFDTRFTPDEINKLRVVYTVVEKGDVILPNFRIVQPELIEDSDDLYDVKVFDRFERTYDIELDRTLNLGGIGRKLIDEFELEKEKLFPLEKRLNHEGVMCYCYRTKTITLYAALHISLEDLKEIIRNGRFYDPRLQLDSNYRLFYVGDSDEYNDVIVKELGKQISDVVE